MWIGIIIACLAYTAVVAWVGVLIGWSDLEFYSQGLYDENEELRKLVKGYESEAMRKRVEN